MPERVVAARIRVREIRDPDDPAFAAAYNLLRKEFPRSEMMPLADWRNVIRERRAALWTDVGWHLLVAQRGKNVIGAASGSYLGNVNVGVIGYIAVHPESRAAGLGPRLRRALLRKFEADAKRVGWKRLAAVIGEVHEDNPWLRHLVRREGAIALDFSYFQPSLGGNRKPVGLVMYYQPIGARRQTLSSAELRRLLYTMWRRSYRIPRPLAQPEFRRMLRSLEGKRRVGQRDLGRANSRPSSR